MAVSLAVILTSCADVRLQQDENIAIIRPNPKAEAFAAADIAGHFLPYALLAMAAYDDQNLEMAQELAGEGLAKGTRWDQLREGLGPAYPKLALDWLKGWERLRIASKDNACVPGESDCKSWGGLGVNLWKRKDCTEVVLAFRGTDFKSASDWLSNLRWFTRILPGKDQYNHTRDNVKAWLDELHKACPGRKRIVALGHSLGGGLAQLAAYADSRIRHVYAFDPSVVTGYYSTNGSCANARGLAIDRVYEHGEVLAYLRFIFRQVYPPSLHDPAIRNVRFNLITEGSFVDQHSMAKITARLMTIAGPPDGSRPNGRKPLPQAVRDPQAAQKDCG